jgi:hypothetical protein
VRELIGTLYRTYCEVPAPPRKRAAPARRRKVEPSQ